MIESGNSVKRFGLYRECSGGVRLESREKLTAGPASPHRKVISDRLRYLKPHRLVEK